MLQPSIMTRAPGRARHIAYMLIALACICLPPARAASLDPALLPAIQAATFEVVAAKPERDPLTYERPLPLDQIPFQERNDKYYSIGTAFAIGDGRYVTAAHVLLVGVNSLWGAPALRDNAGRVYRIGNVLKFSLEKDFVVFTLDHPPSSAALAFATGTTSGQTVYTVGNAYGTGVVIRDGLYTSDTPEPQDGRWKLMRFSAPASPGNSGGPLVDQSGKVVGVVLAKSPNENLNYALPIAQVRDAPDGIAEADTRVTYQLDVFDTTSTADFRTRLELPASLPDFYKAFAARMDAFSDAQIKAVLAKDTARLFPNGEGSEQLLNGVADLRDFPQIIGRTAGGKWVLAGERQDAVTLQANGYVRQGSLGRNSLFHLRRPDDIPAARFYADPEVPMDLVLKAGYMNRDVGGQGIRVTSLGKPESVGRYADAWGRPWQVWTWPLPYANYKLIVMALPVPNGYVGVARSTPAPQEHEQRNDLRALADFTYVNYDGTLAQWKDFLAQQSLQPLAMRDIAIDFDYGKRFHYASPRLEASFGPDVQDVRADSVLTLGFTFNRERDKVVWDVGDLWISANSTDADYLTVVRQAIPPASLGEEFASDWNRMRDRRHPYDGVSSLADDVSKASSVLGPPAADKPALLYTATIAVEGIQPQAGMTERLERLVKGIDVREH